MNHSHHDPRADSEEKIIPPEPLPFVSRRSLRRVTDILPAPQSCPYCEGSVDLVENSEIYGRKFGHWPYAYLCRPCRAYVGLHPKTDLPLGTLADADLREARKTNKGIFLSLSNKKGWGRKESYAWLAKRLGIERSECHWGWFDIEQCRAAGNECRAEFLGKETS